MTFHRTAPTSTRRSSAAALGISLVLAVALAVLPNGWTAWLRSGASTLLQPGQVAALQLRRQGKRMVARATCHFQAASGLADARCEVERLQQENHRLRVELAAADRRPLEPPDEPAGRLLRPQCVPAHVLGRQARAFLQRHHLLDVGSASAIEQESLVIDWPAAIDRGGDADLAAGNLVLHGRCVWGKVVRPDRHTSVVCTVAERGYRDLVQLVGGGAKPEGGRQWPRGILEGTGERQARVRLVEVTQPVSVGDSVYTAALQGVLPAPLLYGRVVRLKRPVGAAHWEIWMQPAVAGDEPARVAVLRTELNPLRVAARRKEP